MLDLVPGNVGTVPLHVARESSPTRVIEFESGLTCTYMHEDLPHAVEFTIAGDQ